MTEEIKEEINEISDDEIEVIDESQEEVVEDVIDPKDEEIERLIADNNRLKNAYAMAYADTENLKKRLNAESEMVRKYRIQSFATEILPVIDNLERALASENEKESAFYKGIEMIYNQLITALKNEGVEEIDCLNKVFDPKFAQSIMMEKVEDVESNTVIQVLQKGYMLKDRVLRAAMVKIAE